jgi:hypothetical protein
MTSPAVLIVGADKGGVGKTTVARTLIDYLAARRVPARAFDTEAPKGTLKRFHPDVAEIVDMTSVGDQMRVFDTLSDGRATVIDVRAGSLSPMLRALRDIGFIDAANKGEIALAMVHVLGPSLASLNEIAETAEFVKGGRHVLVKNFINNASFFEWDQATRDFYFRRANGAVEITIPKLNEMAAEQVELASASFLNFIADRRANGEPGAYSFVLRGYVRHWLGSVWAEYDRIKLLDLVSPREVVQMRAS